MMIEKRTVIFTSEIVERSTGKTHKVAISVLMYTNDTNNKVIHSIYQVGFYVREESKTAPDKWRFVFGTADKDERVITDYYLDMMSRLINGKAI